MKRYDAWSESDPQCGFGGGRCELYERTLGQYVTFDDHEREVSALRAELARVKAESLRVVESECQDMNLASDWYMTPDGLGWLGYDRHDCECVETPHGYRKFDECRKVKLGRWEDE